MSLDVKVIDNGDHTCIVWLPSDLKPIPGCRGFAVRRLKNGKEDYLHGSVGFSDDDKLDHSAPWKFPVQRYMWWDYFVSPGDKVQYSVVPVTGKAGHLALAHDLASELTPEMEITGQATPNIAAYFNKGIVAAQWVSRALAAEPKGSKIKDLVATKGDHAPRCAQRLAATADPRFARRSAQEQRQDLRGAVRAERSGTDRRPDRARQGLQPHPGERGVQTTGQRREQRRPGAPEEQGQPLRPDREVAALRAQQVRRLLRRGRQAPEGADRQHQLDLVGPMHAGQ